MGQNFMDFKETGMNKKIGIVDCNNFYVSCERVFNPVSIGKPTVVLSNNDGCVIARSQEAKNLGIKMGQNFFLSKDFMIQNNFCVYSSNYNLYGDMSDRVMSVIKRHAKEIEVYSIDECFVDLSNIPHQDLHQRLGEMRDDVKRLTGIPVSIGIGPSKTLAKLTSHLAKQKQTFEGVCSYWHLSQPYDSLHEIPVSEVWGIGRKWSRKLEELGILNVGQYINQRDGLIRGITNVNGLRTKLELTGTYCYHVQKMPKAKKSIAFTRSFGQDVHAFDQLAEAMHFYIQSGIRKLKDNEAAPNEATIFISGNPYRGEDHSVSKQIRFTKQTRDEQDIWAQVYPHLKNLYVEGRGYKKCGIVFSRLMPQSTEQGILFPTHFTTAPTPVNKERQWEMRSDYISQKFTTSWDEIPLVFE